MACRNDSPVPLVLSGIVLGGAFLTRPYDSVLFALPFAVYIVATRRHDLPKVAKIAGWVALGVLPALVIAVAYNLATTGSPLRFPVAVQSEGFSKFGWGVRSIAADTPELNFTVLEAVESMGTNLFAVPTWLFGTYLTLAVAGFGAYRLWKTNRAICGLLLGLTFVWPIGYLAWWASSLTTNGALNGLGPHYYLPMLAPLAVLAAHGAGELVEHRRKLLIGGLVAALLITAIALPPKINEKHGVDDASRKYSREVTAGLRQRDGEPALVIQERRRSSYIMEPYPFLANPPDLDTELLYARDRGARNVKLLEQTPDRRAFRLVRQIEPGGELGQLPVVVKPQSVIRGGELTVHATIINSAGKKTVTAYARFGKSVQRRLLSTNATKDEQFDVTWTLGPDGLRYSGPPARRMRPIKVRDAARRGMLVVGATFARSPSVKDPDGVERWYYARVNGRPGRAAHRGRGVDPIRHADPRLDPDRRRRLAPGRHRALLPERRSRPIPDGGVMLRSPAVAETWRFVDCGAVDAFENNAQMAVLSRSSSDSGTPILQTSVWGRTHLNVGWFDDVDSTLDLAECERLGIQVIRRPFAGGGTAFYDAGCAVMFGLMLPKTGDAAEHVDLDAVIARLQPIVLDALARLDLGEVTFQGSADLRWINDRKLGGISAGDFGRVLSVGGFLNIKPPNLDLYLQVVRVPEGKFADKVVSDMREYVCTAEEVAGHAVSYEEFRDALDRRGPGRRDRARRDDDDRRRAGRPREDLPAHRERRPGPAHLLRPLPRRALGARCAGRASRTTRAASCAGPGSRSTAPAGSWR